MSNLPYDPSQEPRLFQTLHHGFESDISIKELAGLAAADIGLRVAGSKFKTNTPGVNAGANVDVKKLDKELSKSQPKNKKYTIEYMPK
jgi:hypothetical protein